MKIIFNYILFFTLMIQSGYSIENIYFSRLFDIQNQIIEQTKKHTFSDIFSIELVSIYQINISEEKVFFQYGTFNPLWAGSGWEYNWHYFFHFYAERKSGDVILVDYSDGKPNLGDQLHNISIDIPQPTQEVDPSEGTTNTYIDIVAFDSQQEKIGGLVRWESYIYPPGEFYSGFSVHIWDVASGKRMFSQNYPHRYTFLNSAPSTKILFSPKDRFLIANEIYDATSYSEKFDVCLPASSLLDTKTYQFIQAVNRDVAFTSDERYYCTERDGLPSLVDAVTHEVLYRYQTGVTMTACCFSPDNRKLYIACEDLNIYEFDSQVPFSSVKEWEIYDYPE